VENKVMKIIKTYNSVDYRILKLTKIKKRTVSELVELCYIARVNVWKRLNRLCDLGLIKRKKVGRNIYLENSIPHFLEIKDVNQRGNS